MDDESLVEELERNGRVTAQQVALWRDSAALLSVLDAIGRDGANALIKVDGSRPDGSIYTVVLSGGRLGEAFFRKDGADWSALLREAISFYRAQVWSAHG